MSRLLDRRTLLRAAAVTLSLPAFLRNTSAATPIDVFGIAGQSNSVGFPEAQDAIDWSPIPIPGTAFKYSYNNGLIEACVDPVYPTTTGSAWPMFAKTYYALTGRLVCIISTGKGGSGMWVGQCTTTTPINVNGCWDPLAIASHTPESIGRIQTGLAALTTAGYAPTFKGLIWAQGEADAAYVNVAQETMNDYILAFNRAIQAYRVSGLGGKFYVSKLGTVSDDVSAAIASYKIIRAAEEYCVNGNSDYAVMVFRGALQFPSAQSPYLQQFPANLHYTQRAYNRLGMWSAINVVNDQLGVPFTAT